ncbi:hypothetical protein LP419_07475 [Massilia sp. H-1]|nr:hypothetical protein LP419_07475 [Massilia sp. H-1]
MVEAVERAPARQPASGTCRLPAASMPGCQRSGCQRRRSGDPAAAAALRPDRQRRREAGRAGRPVQ